MFKIYPTVDINPQKYLPIPDVESISNEIFWQGIHICGKLITKDNQTLLFDLPVKEASIRPSAYEAKNKKIYSYFQTGFNWYTNSYKNITESPNARDVEFSVIKRSIKKYKKVVVISTLDAWYGHSLVVFFHVQHLIKRVPEDIGIIILLQPFLEWMVPKEGIAEIWKANIKLSEGHQYFPLLNTKINNEIKRFEEVYLSESPVQADGFNISMYTGVPIFSIEKLGKGGNRITFIWREDLNRLWLKNFYLYGILKVTRLQKILLPLHKLRVQLFLSKLRRRLGNNVIFTVAGFGCYGKFPSWIQDKRVTEFNEEVERGLCSVYAESEIVVGIHGSSMILPSAHAGMTISIMPHKRWGNFAQDLVFNNEKTFRSLFLKRIVPINMPISELADICHHMKNDILTYEERLRATNYIL